MLLIKKGDLSKLPIEYHFINNICAYIYDHLTSIVANANYVQYLRASTFNFPDEKIPEMPSIDEHILDWLAKNGKTKEIQHVLVKHVSMSVLSDLINFVYESLNTARKGKVSVAYSLLRKPFTDELFILEQLLVEPEVFINSFFFDGNPEAYDPSKKNTTEHKKRVISESLKKIPNFGISSKLVYDFRYEKSCEYGINGISNRALHIVTNDKHYKTKNQNFNFVFSNAEDYAKYFSHYYLIVPMLLMYTASVVDELVFQFLPEEIRIKDKSIRELQRVAAFESLNKAEGLFAWLLKQLSFECENCDMKGKLSVDTIAFLESGTFFCPKCKSQIVFSQEDIEVFKLFLDTLRDKDVIREV